MPEARSPYVDVDVGADLMVDIDFDADVHARRRR
jgi:hypothetical protein